MTDTLRRHTVDRLNAQWERERETPSHPPDDDCEDQELVSTDVCIKFECQSWDGNVRNRPTLVLRGKYWCCPKCGASYGEHAKGVPINVREK
jgi:hypothetical protein